MQQNVEANYHYISMNEQYPVVTYRFNLIIHTALGKCVWT